MATSSPVITIAITETKNGSFTSFLFAVRGGQIEAAKALLDAAVPVEESLPDGTSALVLAVINAHYELAAVLLDRGANPNADAVVGRPLARRCPTLARCTRWRGREGTTPASTFRDRCRPAVSTAWTSFAGS